MDTLREVLQHLREGRWYAAHQQVQEDHSDLGAWLHDIVHVQEGDLEDAEYGYGKAGRHFRSRGTLDEEMLSLEAALARQPAQVGLSPGATGTPAP
jgi:hypothetical protein